MRVVVTAFALLMGCSRDRGGDASGVTITRVEGGIVANPPRSAALDVPRNEETAGASAFVSPSAVFVVPSIVPSGCMTWKGRYEDAMRAKDYDCVRGMLLPKLGAKTISSKEARFLKAACSALADTACVTAAAAHI